MAAPWTLALVICGLVLLGSTIGVTDHGPGEGHPATVYLPGWADLNLPLPSGSAPNFCAHITSSSQLVYDVTDGYLLALDTSTASDGYCSSQFAFENGQWAFLGRGPNQPAGYGPISNFAVTFDPKIGEVLAYGGEVCDFPQGPCEYPLPENETWEYSGGTWNLLPTSVSPDARAGGGPGSLAYDDGDGVALLVSGTETWAFSSGSWTNVTSSLQPPDLPFVLATDSTSGGVLWLGGGCTWQFLHGAWANLTSSLSIVPVLPGEPVMTDDPAVDGVLLFGGATDATWVFNGVSWGSVTAGLGGPAPRNDAGATYDPAASGVLLWGGFVPGAGGGALVNDTWYYGLTPPAHPESPGGPTSSPSTSGTFTADEDLETAIGGSIVLVITAAALVVVLNRRRRARGEAQPPAEPATDTKADPAMVRKG